MLRLRPYKLHLSNECSENSPMLYETNQNSNLFGPKCIRNYLCTSPKVYPKVHQKLHFAPYLRCNGINVQKSFPASRLLKFISFNPELKWYWGQTRSFCSLSGKIDNHFPKSFRFMINKLVPYFMALQ